MVPSMTDTETIVESARPSGSNRGRAHPGPPLAVPAVAFVVTFAASVLAGPVIGTGTFPSPYAEAGVIQRYFAANQTATGVGALFLMLSATALVFFSAIAWSRLTFLAPNVPGPAIAAFGGLSAAALLGVAGSLEWVLSRSSVTSQPGLVRMLDDAVFVTGGPAHTAALGTAVLGMAVTTWFVRRTPRWLSVLGVVIAVIDITSMLSLLTSTLTPLIPIGRLGSMIWIVAMSVLLPRTRAARGGS
jgi:hypothetical protein